ncbi:DUF1800 domain-containing protein [Tistrella mobilis]|uniref:DUF1800 domain-containing protein n=1 Tax=Tistrella mobilis TaxID=171437 RepID=UPI003557BB63
MISADAVVALTRFGTGYRADLAEAAARDPRGWVRGQLRGDDARQAIAVDVPPLAERVPLLFPTKDEQTMQGTSRIAAERSKLVERVRDARILTALRSTVPFQERLVRFWFEHFTISMRRPALVGVTDVFEAEAIRPHIRGSFRNLLGAVAHHPMMHVYLDNTLSIGPNSPVGKRAVRGINENLARELLELHSLGVDGGYTQTDVREVAKVLTGWQVAASDRNAPYRITFDPARHEPGDKIFLGHTIREAGKAEPDQVLDILATHPSTARFISYKLARHFIDDTPPEDLVVAMTSAFSETDGDLVQVIEVMLDHPSAWAPERRKVLLPEDWGIAFASLLGADGEEVAADIRKAGISMGHRVYAAESPKGWTDERGYWFTPDAVLLRSAWANRLYEAFGTSTDVDLLVGIYLQGASDDVVRLVRGAPTPKDAFSLIAASPYFNLR